jgi:hypothetical protein
MVNLDILSGGLILLAIFSLFFYTLLRLFLRKKILSFFDALHFGVIQTSFAMAGVMSSVFFRGSIPAGYVGIMIVFFAFFFGAMVASNPKPVAILELSMSSSHQSIFALIISAVLIINIFINRMNSIFAIASGTQARVNMTVEVASPTLLYLSSSLSGLLVVLFFLTGYKRVKRIAVLGMFVALISGLLSNSKSSVFAIVIWVACGLFLVDIKLRVAYDANLSGALENLKITKHRLKVLFKRMSILVLFLLPLWLIFLKVGDDFEGASMVFLNRIFLGYDSFIWLFSNDVDVTQVAHKLSLIDLWFYTYVKNIVGTPEFQSIGQYSIYLATGDPEFAKTGLNPNSNLVLELIMTQGIMIAVVLSFLMGYFVFEMRSRLLSSPKLGLFGLCFFYLFVFGSGLLSGPLAILQDGSYFVDGFLKTIIFATLVWLFLKLLQGECSKKRPRKFRQSVQKYE